MTVSPPSFDRLAPLFWRVNRNGISLQSKSRSRKPTERVICGRVNENTSRPNDVKYITPFLLFSVIRPYNILPVPSPVTNANTRCICFRENTKICSYVADRKASQSKFLCIFFHSLEHRFSTEGKVAGLSIYCLGPPAYDFSQYEKSRTSKTLKFIGNWKIKKIYKMLHSQKVDSVECAKITNRQ